MTVPIMLIKKDILLEDYLIPKDALVSEPKKGLDAITVITNYTGESGFHDDYIPPSHFKKLKVRSINGLFKLIKSLNEESS